MIDIILKNFEFQEKERQVLIFLLEKGKGTASGISKATALKRPTVYAVLENLCIEGYVNKTKEDKITFFSTLPIDKFCSFLKQKAIIRAKRFSEYSDELETYVKNLSTSVGQNIGGFYIETINSFEILYDYLGKALLAGDFEGIFNPRFVFNKESKPYIKNFLKQTEKNKPRIRELAVPGSELNWYTKLIKNPNHQVKKLNKKCKIITDMIILSENVLFFDYNEGKVIKINNSDFSVTMRSIFEIVWGSV